MNLEQIVAEVQQEHRELYQPWQQARYRKCRA